MKLVLLVGGTSETGPLAQALAGAGFSVLVSTATGLPLSIGSHPAIRRRSGRLSEEEFEKLMRRERIAVVVNAAHPYAVDVRAIVQRTAGRLNIPHVAFMRPGSKLPSHMKGIHVAANHEQAARLSAAVGGNILLTIGVNNLTPYVEAARRKKRRLVARVLPHDESLAACRKIGLQDDQILTVRGVPGVKENMAGIRRHAIAVLVTKDGGQAGGLPEKLEAARRTGCRVVIVQRPAAESDSGLATVEATLKEVRRLVSEMDPMETRGNEGIRKEAHGGNLRALAHESGLAAAQILDFSANINPLGPVPALRRTLHEAFPDVLHYPDPDNVELVQSIHARFGWPMDRIVVGNGASELLHALCRALKARRAIIPVPSYSDYAVAAERVGAQVLTIPMMPESKFSVPWIRIERMIRKNDVVILGSPNNPTGRLIPGRTLRSIARRHPAARFVVDESFLEFVPGASSIADRLPANVIMVRSLTKFHAIPGLRLGLIVARAPWVKALRRQLSPWSVNSMANRAGIVSMTNSTHAARTVKAVECLRGELAAGLRKLNALQVFDAAANFILVRLRKSAPDAWTLHARLLKKGIAIRVCSNFPGLDDRYFRVAVRPAIENRRLLTALHAVLEE